jgi:hypothetical protein
MRYMALMEGAASRCEEKQRALSWLQTADKNNSTALWFVYQFKDNTVACLLKAETEPAAARAGFRKHAP